ncbi:hypothetical protein [Methanothermococcus sp.]|nr:hypothetical protein [Methanothermococcus sp.]
MALLTVLQYLHFCHKGEEAIGICAEHIIHPIAILLYALYWENDIYNNH